MQNMRDVVEVSIKNNEFYKNGTEYLEYLRKKGITDNGSEDEYYFTLSTISNH